MARALVGLFATLFGPVFARAWRYGPVRAVVISAYALLSASFVLASYFSVFQMGGFGAVTGDSAYFWGGLLAVAVTFGAGGLLLGWDRPQTWWRRALWLSSPTVLALLWMISQGAFVGPSLLLLLIALPFASGATWVGATTRSAFDGTSASPSRQARRFRPVPRRRH